MGGTIALVFADRACPGLEWAAEQGFDTALVPGGDDATLAETLRAVDPDVVVLAGYMRIVGPETLPRSRVGSSTRIRRCCRPSRARTPWRTPSRTA